MKTSPPEAVDAVLRDNLHGLELDPRCVEIAAFALALTAWTYPNAGGYRKLPELHIACTGLSVGKQSRMETAWLGQTQSHYCALTGCTTPLSKPHYWAALSTPK